MRLSYTYLALLAAVLAFTACDDDDDAAASCTAADFVGTYTGTGDCDDYESAVSVVITPGSTSDAIDIELTETSLDSTIFFEVTTELDDVVVEGCSATLSGSEDGVTVSFVTTLDDGRIEIVSTFTEDGESDVCTYTATR